MRTGVVAKKVGMTRVFADDGSHIPVTVLSLEGCQVVGLRTKDVRDVEITKGKKKEKVGARKATDGYTAVVLGAGAAKARNVSQPQRGQFAKAKVEPKAIVREFRVSDDMMLKVGEEISADHFVKGQKVDIAGITKGKGFQGVIKRWHFGGMRATHGVSITHRAHGSTGQRQDPGRVFKGKKMAGHLGVARITAPNIEVVRTDAERGLILVRGAVPGPADGWVEVRDAVRGKRPEGLPKPAGLKAKG